MPRFSAEQIYAFARQAGFSPDQAATMTAVALAESGGDSRAHNPVGEDSRGLWQINARTHAGLAQRLDLYDPVENAKAAYEISRHGTDISPWTATHNGQSARYLRFQEEAQAAAVAHGDGSGRGVWTGTTGYGDHRSAGAAADGTGHGQTGAAPAASHGTEADAAATAQHGTAGDRQGEEYGIPLENGAPVAGRQYGLPLETHGDQAPAPDQPGEAAVGTAAAAPAGDDKLARFVEAALAQNGDRYVYGAETRPDDPNPSAFDCSELVEWAAHQAGLSITDGALWQYRQLRGAGTTMSVEEAIHTRGALLFSFSSDPVTGRPTGQHVAISLGDGRTIEAHNTRAGVGVFEANTRRFNYAGMIPGTGTGGAPDAATQAEHAPAVAAPEPSAAHGGGHGFSAGPASSASGASGASDGFHSRLHADPYRLDHDTLPASLRFTGPTTPVVPGGGHQMTDAHAPTEHDDAAVHTTAHGADDGLHLTVDWVDLGAHHDTGAGGGHDTAHGGH